MTKIIGLTGGIGSGKSTVAQMFKDLGVPTYISDYHARGLMENSNRIRKSLVILFGKNAYKDGVLNRSYISSKVFNNSILLSKLNSIVHPEVKIHFENWLLNQKSRYVIKEVAILFEINSENDFDYIISVVAPKKERAKRVVLRGNHSKSDFNAIMNNQLTDAYKVNNSDFVINNKIISDTKKQVFTLHNFFLNN
jgi:dephospho-CoA kinase